MYLALLQDNLADTEVRILAYCLMPNHIHLVAIPSRPDSFALLLSRVHGRHAQAVNSIHGRTGHLWQNRYFSCPLSERHLWVAIRYVEQNPVRAMLAPRPEDFKWSSAQAHLVRGSDKSGVLDMEFWRSAGGVDCWRNMHDSLQLGEQTHFLRRCTYAGRPFGDDQFVTRMEETFQRKWRRWGFEKMQTQG